MVVPEFKQYAWPCFVWSYAFIIGALQHVLCQIPSFSSTSYLGELFPCSLVDFIQTALCSDMVLWECDRARPPGSTNSQTRKVVKREYTLHLIIPACGNRCCMIFSSLFELPSLSIKCVDPDELALTHSHQRLGRFASHANHDLWHSQTFTYILVFFFYRATLFVCVP